MRKLTEAETILTMRNRLKESNAILADVDLKESTLGRALADTNAALSALLDLVEQEAETRVENLPLGSEEDDSGEVALAGLEQQEGGDAAPDMEDSIDKIDRLNAEIERTDDPECRA